MEQDSRSAPRTAEDATGRLTVDVWAQQPGEGFLSVPWLAPLLRWTGRDRVPPTLEETLAAMDAARVDVTLLSGWHGPDGPLTGAWRDCPRWD